MTIYKSDGIMTIMIVETLSFLCMLIGLAATAAYAVTFYLTPYNELYLEGGSGMDDTDQPYLFAIVECALSGATALLGALAFSKTIVPAKRTLLIAILYFAVAVLMEGGFAAVRTWSLGLFGDDMDSTCSDVGPLTGCPTSRFEHHKRVILHTEPHGGDCTTWFWGPNMFTRKEADCSAYPDLKVTDETSCKDVMETYMDWSRASSYGWRDDPSQIHLSVEGTLPKVHNMQIIMRIQEDLNETGKITHPLSTQPALTYCWYWGCHPVCTSHRYTINHWWWMSSLSLFVLYVANLTLTIVLWQRPSDVTVGKGEPAIVARQGDVESPFEIPNFGRRKRAMERNPSVLQF